MRVKCLPTEQQSYLVEDQQARSLQRTAASSKEQQQATRVDIAPHHKSFKTIIKVCKASWINFALPCTAKIYEAIKVLYAEGKISSGGTFNNGDYYKLSSDDKILVNNLTEDICLSVWFLSLANDKVHGTSIQELKNDMIKGENNFPRTMTGTLNFLEHHSLH